MTIGFNVKQQYIKVHYKLVFYWMTILNR